MLNVGTAADFKKNEIRSFKSDNHEICVVRIENELYAFQNSCPHQHMPLDMGMMKDHWVVCSFHGWLFDVRSGECGVSPSCRLRTYQVTVENEQVLVNLESE